MGIRQDGWINVLTGLGVEGKDWRTATAFSRSGPYWTPQRSDELYEGSWLFERVCDTIPKHSTRRGFKVQVDVTDDELGHDMADDVSRGIMKRLQDLKAGKRFYDLFRFARRDGGAAMILGIDDGKEISQPVDQNTIQKVRFLNVVRRHEIQPNDIDADPYSENFLQPASYTLMASGRGTGAGAPPIQEIHWSRVVRLVQNEASEFSPYFDSGWGVPIGATLSKDVQQFETIFGYTEALFKDIAQGTMSVKQLAELLATEHGRELLRERLRMLALTASVFNMAMIDTEEKYEKKSTGGFAGVERILLRFMEKVAAAVGIPLTILFGMSASGFSTDDKGSARAFYDTIANDQQSILADPVERVVTPLMHEREGPTKGQAPSSWSILWNPLEAPTEKEDADTRKVQADTDTSLVQAGLITDQEARTRYLNDPSSPYTLDRELDLDEEDDEPPPPIPIPPIDESGKQDDDAE